MLDAIRAAESEGLDPIWDVQPVVAVNAKSPLSRKAVNELLQRELNPRAGDRPRGSPFSVGDKVVCLKNGYYNVCAINLTDADHAEVVENDRGEVFVANGELGEVLAVSEKSMTAKVRSPERIISIPRGRPSDGEVGEDRGDEPNSEKPFTTGCSWDLGFALSVHKSQGAEWEHVIVMIDEYPGARMICTREWIYTAISRAKSKCVIIGKKSVADTMCRKVAIQKRKTFLRELILKKRAERMLAEM
jgi:exodeoxyribonuclease V alpha subunit